MDWKLYYRRFWVLRQAIFDGVSDTQEVERFGSDYHYSREYRQLKEYIAESKSARQEVLYEVYSASNLAS